MIKIKNKLFEKKNKNLYQLLKNNNIFRDVHSVGVEPTTDGFEIRHSIQLNYECLFTYSIYIGFCMIFLGKIFILYFVLNAFKHLNQIL